MDCNTFEGHIVVSRMKLDSKINFKDRKISSTFLINKNWIRKIANYY